MDTLSGQQNDVKGLNKTFLASLVIGVLVIGIVAWGLLQFRGATSQEQKSQILEGALTEAAPQFEALTRRIVVEKVEDTQATTPLGAVVMSSRSKIRNNSDKVIVALEVKVSVIDTKRSPIREKTVVVVPNEKFSSFDPGQEIELSVSIDGFKEGDDRADIRWKVTAVKVQ